MWRDAQACEIRAIRKYIEDSNKRTPEYIFCSRISVVLFLGAALSMTTFSYNIVLSIILLCVFTIIGSAFLFSALDIAEPKYNSVSVCETVVVHKIMSEVKRSVKYVLVDVQKDEDIIRCKAEIAQKKYEIVNENDTITVVRLDNSYNNLIVL